jgi:hypothetical protein
LCHTCDHPACVNPSHLWLGTALDNNLDRDAKGRTRKGTNHPGAKLTENDVHMIRESSLSNVALSKQFGVAQSAISKVRKGITWKSIPWKKTPDHCDISRQNPMCES